MKKRNFLIFITVVAVAAFYFIGSDALGLPYLAFRTFIRMLGAYALSLVFSLGLGIFIAHNKKAFEMIFPVLDIVQSIPILAYLPFAVIFIIETVPFLGSELATVFLIFTSMTWSIIFNVIEGVRSIPGDIRDAARMNRLSGVDYLFHIVFPAIYGPVISGSITGWGGGWYFLVAGEYISFGKGPPYILEGVGSFITQSAYAGDVIHSIIGIAILTAMVLFMNIFVWQPLFSRSQRFSYSTTASGDHIPIVQNGITRILEKIYSMIKTFSVKRFGKGTTTMMNMIAVKPSSYVESRDSISVYDIIIIGAVLLGFVAIFITSGNGFPEASILVLFSAKTIIRIFVAYLIASIWTVAFATYFARNKKIIEPLMPLFDVAQSIPAIAIFPIIVVYVIGIFGTTVGIEIASILLILTGMQWYLLFNVIRAVQAIPGELIEVSQNLHLRPWQKITNILLPAIFPTFIVSSIQAIGGGWNATIVSEYITYKDQIFYAEGLGYLLDKATTEGNITWAIISVLTMIAIIIFFNKFVW